MLNTVNGDISREQHIKYRPIGSVNADFYVFDISYGCRFISQHSRMIRRLVGSTLYDIMSEEGVCELTKHLMSYTDAPMFVSTTFGMAIAIPSLIPSCSLGILIFPNVGTDTVYHAVKSRNTDMALSSELKGKHRRATLKSKEYKLECIMLMEQIARTFCGTSEDQLISGDICPRLEQRIYELSDFTGTPVGVIQKSDIFATGDFDFSLFTAFILLGMMLDRSCNTKNGMSFCFEEHDGMPCIHLLLAHNALIEYDDLSLTYLDMVAARKNMFYRYMYDPSIIHIIFSPTPFDCSILGIKSPAHNEDDEILIIG